MAKLSTLAAAGARALTDLFYGEQGGIEKKFTLADLSMSGSWTPAIAGSVTAGTNTYFAGTTKGYFVRVGDIVTVFGRIGLSAKDAAMAGEIRLTGLPYLTKNQANGYSVMNFALMNGLTIAAGYSFAGFSEINSDYVRLYESNGLILSAITDADITSKFEVIFSMSYQSA